MFLKKWNEWHNKIVHKNINKDLSLQYTTDTYRFKFALTNAYSLTLSL